MRGVELLIINVAATAIGLLISVHRDAETVVFVTFMTWLTSFFSITFLINFACTSQSTFFTHGPRIKETEEVKIHNSFDCITCLVHPTQTQATHQLSSTSANHDRPRRTRCNILGGASLAPGNISERHLGRLCYP